LHFSREVIRLTPTCEYTGGCRRGRVPRAGISMPGGVRGASADGEDDERLVVDARDVLRPGDLAV
jgi:hypothetical protein